MIPSSQANWRVIRRPREKPPLGRTCVLRPHDREASALLCHQGPAGFPASRALPISQLSTFRRPTPMGDSSALVDAALGRLPSV